jgi:antitoxin component of MazEF toxin-antitoxin module
MTLLARTRRLGGSIIITIPKEIVDAESIVPNELVQISVAKARKNGFGIAKRLSSMKREDALRGQLE